MLFGLDVARRDPRDGRGAARGGFDVLALQTPGAQRAGVLGVGVTPRQLKAAASRPRGVVLALDADAAATRPCALGATSSQRSRTVGRRRRGHALAGRRQGRGLWEGRSSWRDGRGHHKPCATSARRRGRTTASRHLINEPTWRPHAPAPPHDAAGRSQEDRAPQDPPGPSRSGCRRRSGSPRSGTCGEFQEEGMTARHLTGGCDDAERPARQQAPMMKRALPARCRRSRSPLVEPRDRRARSDGVHFVTKPGAASAMCIMARGRPGPCSACS